MKRRDRWFALAAAGLTAAGLFVTIRGSEAVTVGTPNLLLGAASGRCLTVEGTSTTRGARAIAWDCNSKANQRWTYTSAGELRVYSGTDVKCLDVYRGLTDPGARVQTWTCHGGANQKWTMYDDAAAGGFFIYSVQFSTQGLGIITPANEWNLLVHGALRQTLKLKLGRINYRDPKTVWLAGVERPANRVSGAVPIAPGRVASGSGLRPATGNGIVGSNAGAIIALGGANVIALGGANIIALGGANLVGLNGSNFRGQ